LVPALVPYQLFWERYFWREFIAGKRGTVTLGLDEEEEEDIGWDQEDEDAGEIGGGAGGGAASADIAVDEIAVLKADLLAERESSRHLKAECSRIEAESRGLSAALVAQEKKGGAGSFPVVAAEDDATTMNRVKHLERELKASIDAAAAAAAASRETEEKLVGELDALRLQCAQESKRRVAAEEALADFTKAAAHDDDSLMHIVRESPPEDELQNPKVATQQSSDAQVPGVGTLQPSDHDNGASGGGVSTVPSADIGASGGGTSTVPSADIGTSDEGVSIVPSAAALQSNGSKVEHQDDEEADGEWDDWS
jgi:hypothetical protein